MMRISPKTKIDEIQRSGRSRLRICLIVLLIVVLVPLTICGKRLQAQQNSNLKQQQENSLHVSAENLEKTLRLYREILGFNLDGANVLKGEGHDGTLAMKLSGNKCKVNLLLPSLENNKAGTSDTNRNHFVLSVSDVALVCDKLKSEGYELQHEEYARDGYSFFAGPNGETIALTSFPVDTKADDWKELLDENLSQWEPHLGVPHKTVEIPGRPRTQSENGIDGGEAVGLSDPLGVYSVQVVDGEPVLKVTGQVFAGLTSKEEFDSYHLSLQFRWGEKRWEPRLNLLRDSGLLFHCVGPHGVGWNAWMQSLECQIQEGDCGDFIPVDKAQAFVQIGNDGNAKLANYEIGFYDRSKPLKKVRQQIAMHRPSVEYPNGKWNTIEIYTIGTTSVLVVNGIPNMVIFDAQQSVDGEFKPLTRGKLQIQSEAAELEYRRVKIRPISTFPDAFSGLVKRPQ